MKLNTVLKNVEVKAGETNEVEHNFKSGIAMIGVKSGGKLLDGAVTVYEINTNTNVASGRTYKSESNNPMKFIVNPGTYKVITMPVYGDHKGKRKPLP